MARGGPGRERRRVIAGAAGRLLAPHRPALVLTLLAAALYLPCVWTRGLWSPDEPRYAEVARQMERRGDWILPHLNGEVYGEKPPLYFWLGMAAGRLPGVPAAAGPRLVSSLAALATLLLTLRIGRRALGAEAGWIAALVLATSAMFVMHATWGVIDALLTLLVTAAVAVGLRARETGSVTQWAVFYGLVGMGVLAKGPVALVVPAGTLLLLALADHGPRRAGAFHPFWGIPLAAAIVAAWLIPAIARGGEAYADVILFRQNVGRAYDSWHHKEPLSYFLKVFPVSFLPWIVLLPSGLISAWRERRRSPGVRPALAWFAFTFVFFSLMSGKKTRYLLPLFPAASLLVAQALARTGRPGPRGAVALILAVGLAGGLAIASLGAGTMPRVLGSIEGLAEDQAASLRWLASAPGSLAAIVPGLGVALIAAAGLLSLRREPRTALGCAMLSLIVLIGWSQWVAVPLLNPIKSADGVTQAAKRLAGDAGEIGLYPDSFSDSLNAPLQRDRLAVIRRPGDLAVWLEQHPDAVIIALREALEALPSESPPLQRDGCRRIGGDEVCVAYTVK